MNDDLWLEPWLPLLVQKGKPGAEILELGCDTGRDTAYLTKHGMSVVATDISEHALETASQSAPAARYVHHDLREKFPFSDGRFSAVIASLSLHYFDWKKTGEIVAEIYRCLSTKGVLICRLNSTKAVQYGAEGFETIEPNYYRVHGRYSELKRFFDSNEIHRLFTDEWEMLFVQEQTIDRYGSPKVVWEVVVRKLK